MNKLLTFIIDSTLGYRKLISYGCISMILVAIIDNVQPYFVKKIIDAVTADDFSNIWLVVLGFVISQGCIFLAWSLFDYSQYRYSPGITADINRSIVSRISDYPYKFFQNNLSGQLSGKIADLGRNVPQMIDFVINQVFHHGFQMVMSIVLIATVDYYLSIGMVVWIVIFFYVMKKMLPKAEEMAGISAEIESLCRGRIVDYLANMFSVKIFCRKSYEAQLLKENFDELKLQEIEKGLYLRKFYNMQGRGFSIYIIAVLLYMIYLAKNHLITAGDFALVFMLNFTIVDCLFIFIWRLREFITMIGTSNAALELLEAAEQIVDEPGSTELQVKKGEIIFDKVKFHYKDTTPLFQDKSITIKAEEKVGLVGYSGGGKSTFVSLILRLYDVTEGRILIDGQDISKATQDSLRANIAMIPQDPSMFHRSIMENIRYGRIDADDDEVIIAAKRAHAHEFITSLPEGYDALVGEKGVKLSGGQRQRIAIARAFLKNAPILILDEATSQLDSITEEKIQESLRELMRHSSRRHSEARSAVRIQENNNAGSLRRFAALDDGIGKTTIVIAHRLSTLLHMDRILVFDKGKIVQDGTHKSLLKQKGLYKTLWDAQVGGFLPEKKK